MEDLLKTFYEKDTCRKPPMDRGPLEDLLWIRELFVRELFV